MDAIVEFYQYLMKTFGPPIFVPMVLLLAVAIMAQWNLYEKSGLRGVACIVPIWNVTEFLKIMGRPAWHIVFFLIPVYNIYFVVKVYIELCKSFGKNSLLDYVLVLVFNGFYILYLGMAEEVVYKGPVYKMKKEDMEKSKGAVGSPSKEKATAPGVQI